MTPEQLQEIRKRAEAAPALPWGLDNAEEREVFDAEGYSIAWVFNEDSALRSTSNFLVRSKQDVLALLDEVKRLREALEKIEDLMPLHERERREISRAALEGK